MRRPLGDSAYGGMSPDHSCHGRDDGDDSGQAEQQSPRNRHDATPHRHTPVSAQRIIRHLLNSAWQAAGPRWGHTVQELTPVVPVLSGKRDPARR